MTGNTLFYGDNLEVLRQHIADESVDLVYLDPPFNSNRNYNVLFGKHARTEASDAAQIQAFADTWAWTPVTDQQYTAAVSGELPGRVADVLVSMRTLLGENDAMAYLVNMAPRLVELQRVLKSTGSLYLHCDPTMSHYLKIILDAIFGPERFRSEIIWRRYGSHNDARGYGAVHDVILYYAKGNRAKFNKQYVEYDESYVAQRFRTTDNEGRRWMEQNLSSPNPRPNLTYPYTASNGITYQPPANGWKVTPERMAELDREGRLHFPAKQGGRLRMKNFLDEGLGVPVQDIWTDIVSLGGTDPERLGYPTQKPVALDAGCSVASAKRFLRKGRQSGRLTPSGDIVTLVAGKRSTPLYVMTVPGRYFGRPFGEGIPEAARADLEAQVAWGAVAEAMAAGPHPWDVPNVLPCPF